jgi:uncharacterized protein YggE
MNREDVPPGITVRGIGEVLAEPDTGFFTVGVQVTRKSVASARKAAAVAAAGVIEKVRAAGVEAGDIRTSSLSIQPQYRQGRHGEAAVIAGYQVTNTVNVTVRDLEQFSDIVDAALEAGGDDARLGGIRFGLKDDREATTAARKAAMADARRIAQELADEGGVRLGAPVSISESDEALGPTPRMAMMAMSADSGPATPIESGSTTVRVAVVVRYGIDA